MIAPTNSPARWVGLASAAALRLACLMDGANGQKAVTGNVQHFREFSKKCSNFQILIFFIFSFFPFFEKVDKNTGKLN